MNTKLQNKFSLAAHTYDERSILQRRIASQLLDWMGNLENISTILDIGTGTGSLARQLIDMYPDLSIFGIDFALGMLQISKDKDKNTHFIQSDAKQLPFKDESLDLAMSNVAYQWVDRLDLAFGETKRILRKNGRFCFTVFTKNTLRELRESLFFVSSRVQKRQIEFDSLHSREEILQSLQDTGFTIMRSDIKTYTEFYPKLMHLLSWLKDIGANRFRDTNVKSGLYGRGLISELSSYYESTFRNNGKIYATFEALFVEALKQ